MTERAARPAPAGLPPGAEADAWRGAAETGVAKRVGGPVAPAWTPASASLSVELEQQIFDWLRQGLPNEACGLLAAAQTAEDGGTPSRFLPMRNAAESPYRYEIDSQDLFRTLMDLDDRDEVVWGIVHSHVASKAEPSATDVGLAAYPDALYLVCSMASEPPELRAWLIVNGRVTEVVLHPF